MWTVWHKVQDAEIGIKNENKYECEYETEGGSETEAESKTESESEIESGLLKRRLLDQHENRSGQVSMKGSKDGEKNHHHPAHCP